MEKTNRGGEGGGGGGGQGYEIFRGIEEIASEFFKGQLKQCGIFWV